MNVFQIIMIIKQVLDLLRSLKKDDQVTFGAKAQEFGLDGSWVQKLWENREAILAFALRLIELFQNKPVIGATQSTDPLEALKQELQSTPAAPPQV